MSLKYAFSPSGGALYHFISYRRVDGAWRAFRASVRAWLGHWRTDDSRELMIFGPSAGWTLPLEEFAMARRLVIIEPDPIARILLSRRLRAAGVSLEVVDWISDARLLPWFSKSPSDFADFLGSHPNADILFANLLGQVSLHMSSAERTSGEAQRLFLEALRGRRWASYHDLYSGPGAASLSASSVAPTDLSQMDGIAAATFASGPVTDHETQWLSGGRTTSLALWPMTESQMHLIGFVSE